MESRLAKLTNVVLENNTKKDVVGANNQVCSMDFMFFAGFQNLGQYSIL